MEHVSLAQLIAATGGRVECPGGHRSDGSPSGPKCPEHFQQPTGFDSICIDSRTLQPGELFWALKGERHDGHHFVADAFRRGAAAAVVARNPLHDEAGGSLILVPDTLQALWDLAAWYRESREALIVGVTGSFAKSTTRAMIHAVLEARYGGTQSPRNFNNHFGVPLSILEIDDDHEFAVLEFAASAVGEIRRLAQLAAPEIGVITGIGPAHLSGFGSEQRILAAKSELIEAVADSGIAVLAGDDPRLQQLAERVACRFVLVGEGPQNDVRATCVTVENNRLRFCVGSDEFELAVAGRHHLIAALCAIAIAREVDVDAEEIAAGLASFTPLPGRCERKTVGPWTLIDDTYNANPASMQAACDLLAEWQTTGQKLLVVGDMLELGRESAAFHRQLGSSAAAAGIDHLIVFGDQARDVVRGAVEAGMESHRLAECNSLEAALTVLDCCLEPGDVILVKGSRGMRMERAVQWMQSQIHSGAQPPRGPLRRCA